MGTTLNFVTMLNVDAFGAIHDIFILSSHDNPLTSGLTTRDILRTLIFVH
ncbi:hypothetical protein Xkoz_01814 [Xenorhabdus kozodoii]|uniref:Uncharacterized protein n=1 Tax=Xenorhabdus kozodoii TaxID=351676 RepID=A0A2D0LCM2_9GAMM|nr:hypothetical protein Xkoz_01814 [Xenorhabdus kozodoii]